MAWNSLYATAGSGRVYVKTPDMGSFQDMGIIVEDITVAPKRETKDLEAGLPKAVYVSVPIKVGFEISFTVAEVLNPDVISIVFSGIVRNIRTSGTASITGEVVFNDVSEIASATDQEHQIPHKHLAHGNIVSGSVIVKDSASTPTTLTEGTNYLLDYTWGILYPVGDWSGYTFPIVIDYTYNVYAGDLYEFFKPLIAPVLEVMVIHRSPQTGEYMAYYMPRGQIREISELALKPEDFVTQKVTVTALADPTDPSLVGKARKFPASIGDWDAALPVILDVSSW